MESTGNSSRNDYEMKHLIGRSNSNSKEYSQYSTMTSLQVPAAPTKRGRVKTTLLKFIVKCLLNIVSCCCRSLGVSNYREGEGEGDYGDITLYRVQLYTGGWVSSSNRISTTKYNFISFLPKFLFDQFRRLPNLFFLMVSIIQFIPGVSPYGHFSTALPLLCVLLIAAVKEIIEDLRRYKTDKEVNNRIVEVLIPNEEDDGEILKETYWKDVRAGDVVCIKRDDFFPSDLLLLWSIDTSDICYVQTTSLDGESNLKIRHAHPLTTGLKETDIHLLKGFIECELPNSKLYEFTGSLKINDNTQQTIQASNILLRGGQLRNTDYIYGAVIYTGHDTKIMQNRDSVPLKRSHIDSTINKMMLLMFLLLLIFAFISALCSTLWNVSSRSHWYLFLKRGSWDTIGATLFSILTFIDLYSSFVPISLIVTMEIVKIVQGMFISWDEDMYDSETNKRAQTRNSNLNEELGQVQYIFSDKTGTLTKNIMSLKKCSINGQIYNLTGKEQENELLLQNELQTTSEVLHFIKTLCLCHSIIAECVGGDVRYYATSTDEEAFVKAAQEMGVVYESYRKGIITLNIFGKREEYKVLETLPFTSARQRMSVIVETPTGMCTLLSKGSDTEMMSRMIGRERQVNMTTQSHVNQFALTGLRIMCVGEKTLTNEEYKLWKSQFDKANVEGDLDNMNELYEDIEKDLHLLGATAVEDQLQENVPETIVTLRAADIRIWVLTGDKMETAINTGYSSGLIANGSTNLYYICGTSEEAIEGTILEHISIASSTNNNTPSSQYAVITSGKVLSKVLQSKDISQYFYELTVSASTVICCRVSPSQKSSIIDLVKRICPDVVTLAIGDGANDVSMIQVADVGIGIAGKEGTQAEMASDYSISQFHFLTKLLLVHGSWNYQRILRVILYMFYKNITLYIIEFWYAIHSGFSGQSLISTWPVQLFNVVFTALPPFVIGFMEQDAPAKTKLSNPSLYRKGLVFNTLLFSLWILLSVLHSLINFYGTKQALDCNGSAHSNGYTTDLVYIGNIMFTVTVITVNMQAYLLSNYWNIFTHIAVWTSIGVWIIYLIIFSHTRDFILGMMGQDTILFSSVSFYGVSLLLPAVCILPEVFIMSYKYMFFPNDAHTSIPQVTKSYGSL